MKLELNARKKMSKPPLPSSQKLYAHQLIKNSFIQLFNNTPLPSAPSLTMVLKFVDPDTIKSSTTHDPGDSSSSSSNPSSATISSSSSALKPALGVKSGMKKSSFSVPTVNSNFSADSASHSNSNSDPLPDSTHRQRSATFATHNEQAIFKGNETPTQSVVERVKTKTKELIFNDNNASNSNSNNAADGTISPPQLSSSPPPAIKFSETGDSEYVESKERQTYRKTGVAFPVPVTTSFASDENMDEIKAQISNKHNAKGGTSFSNYNMDDETDEEDEEKALVELDAEKFKTNNLPSTSSTTLMDRIELLELELTGMKAVQNELNVTKLKLVSAESSDTEIHDSDDDYSAAKSIRKTKPQAIFEDNAVICTQVWIIVVSLLFVFGAITIEIWVAGVIIIPFCGLTVRKIMKVRKQLVGAKIYLEGGGGDLEEGKGVGGVGGKTIVNIKADLL